MKRFAFTTILALLISTAVGQAGPLDTWTLRSPSLTDKPLYGVAYGNGHFVAAVWDGTVLTSTDGATWVQAQTGTTNYLSGVAYGNGQFVAVGEGGSIVTSADGTNWVQRQSGTTAQLNAAVYGNGQFVTVGGGGGTDARVVILTSTDSTKWVRRLPAEGIWAEGKWDRLQHIAYGNDRFVATGFYDDGLTSLRPILWTSPDGITWVQVETGPTNGVSGIAYGNGRFVGVGSAYVVGSGNSLANTIVTSVDGVNWLQRQSGTTNGLYGIAYGNGQFVAVGGWQDNAGLELSGTIVTSADGVNWVQRSSGTTNLLFAASYGNGHFLAVGDSGTILKSGSIVTLALFPNSSSGLFSLALEGPTGLAYTLQSSTDLLSWQTVTNIISVQPITVIFDALPNASERAFYRVVSQ